MTDREKVVKGLELCLMPATEEELASDVCSHEDCPYYREYRGGMCVNAVIRDALALLTAQEPKIISLTDVVCAEDGSVVWLETYFDGNTTIEPFLVCIDFTQKPVIINGWNSFINVYEKELADSIISSISDRFKVRKFRFWSAWPTVAQREAVAWE